MAVSEEIPLNSQSGNVDYYKYIFDLCNKNNEPVVKITDVQEYLNSPRSRSLDVDQSFVNKINKIAEENPQKTLYFDEFFQLRLNDTNEKKTKRKTVHYWANKYVNLIVPKRTKPKQILKGRRLARSVVESSESYFDEYTCCPPPITMLIISIIEIVFIVIDESVEKYSTLTGTGITGKVLLYDPEKREQAWRYITYMLVHVGYQHIISNVVFQLVIGLPLEMVHGWWRILTIYLAGVLAGSLASSVVDPRVKLAGASGGVYALLTAHISTIIMNWSEMYFASVQMFLLVIFVAGDLGPAIYDRINNKIDTVSSIGHLGGGLAGLLVGIYILKNLKETTKEKYIWWYAVVLYFMLMLTGIALNVFLPIGYFQYN